MEKRVGSSALLVTARVPLRHGNGSTEAHRRSGTSNPAVSPKAAATVGNNLIYSDRRNTGARIRRSAYWQLDVTRLAGGHESAFTAVNRTLPSLTVTEN
jgi:hypothetical protein